MLESLGLTPEMAVVLAVLALTVVLFVSIQSRRRFWEDGRAGWG